jgi:histone-lysine N-methyltransferase SETMAR
VIRVDFLPHYHKNLIHNDMHEAIWKKRHGKMSKNIILLHDNPCPHTENLAKAKLATMGWKVVTCSPYSLDLAPSDFHLFRPMKVDLGGQKFRTDDELKHGVLNWLHSHAKTFHATGVTNFPRQWKKYVSVKT